VLYSAVEAGKLDAYLARPAGGGQWNRRSLSDHVAGSWPGWGLTMPGGLCITPNGRICIALTLVKPEQTDATTIWAHPSSEIVRLDSADAGRTFSARLVSAADPAEPHWLPNLEHPTGFNRVDHPAVIYTAGTRGTDNKQRVANRVFFVG
jgi:hypothetical protein